MQASVVRGDPAAGGAHPAEAGYRHPDYAAVYREFGRPRRLPSCGGWILERPIAGAGLVDGMGCYPLFCCGDWTALGADVEALSGDLVSLVMVTDPFAATDPDTLRGCFDFVRPYKEHCVAELQRPLDEIVSRQRLRQAERALQDVSVEVAADPLAWLDDWIRLHSTLATRHRLAGMKALSREALARLFAVPGFTMLRASHGGRTVGMHLEMVQDDVVFGHLAAFDDDGYRLGASAALHLWEILHFRADKRVIDWGGAAGLGGAAEDGLTTFKRGFSSTTRTAYLCGRIFDRAAYDRLAPPPQDPHYFPAYRRGEFH